jgi:predicted RNase H-like nuclease (RuvC/YqgF family)
MQLPGLDDLESSVARAVEEIASLRSENSALRERLRALGKEIDDLATQLAGMGPGQKTDARKRKRIETKLRAIVEKLA